MTMIISRLPQYLSEQLSPDLRGINYIRQKRIYFLILWSESIRSGKRSLKHYFQEKSAEKPFAKGSFINFEAIFASKALLIPSVSLRGKMWRR